MARLRKVKRVQTGDYGLCVMLDGPVNRVVFYDDDEGRKRICYPDQPTSGSAYDVPRGELVELAGVPVGVALIVSPALLRCALAGGGLLVSGQALGDETFHADRAALKGG